MGIEIEKKYRLSNNEAKDLHARLVALGAEFRGEEFETNSLYAGGKLDENQSILRVRQINETAILTYKEAISTQSSIKSRREDETEVDDGEALHRILTALGFTVSLVYEKRRRTFDFAGCEVVIDELPFGWFAEIEGDTRAIEEAEKIVELTSATVEQDSYLTLTARYGVRCGSIIEVRFPKN